MCVGPSLVDVGGRTVPMNRLTLTAVVLLLVPVARASGATFYVSPSGSDSNPGTASAPWRTVGKVDRSNFAPGTAILFRGGSSFTGATLMPSASGSDAAPIRFGSYGSGRARISNSGGAVWLPPGAHDLTFTNLDLSSSGAVVFASAGTGPGATHILVSGCVIHDSPDAGLINQPQDSAWTIRRNTFSQLGDSGLVIQGDRVTIVANTITGTGWNPAITYGKHGIYDRGPNTTIADNDISDDTGGSGISLRDHGARVFGNAIHDTAYAISLFPEDPKNAGTDAIYYNRMWNITGFAFYAAGTSQTAGTPSRLNVLWSSNTVQLSDAREAINVSDVRLAHVWIANNVFTGSYAVAYLGCATCREFDNDWYGGASYVPDGRGDLYSPPELSSPPALVPAAQSPIIDAGSPSVPDARYASGCDGAVWQYCGREPDLGAVGLVTVVATAAHRPR
jgi:hypothetical protein